MEFLHSQLLIFLNAPGSHGTVKAEAQLLQNAGFVCLPVSHGSLWAASTVGCTESGEVCHELWLCSLVHLSLAELKVTWCSASVALGLQCPGTPGLRLLCISHTHGPYQSASSLHTGPTAPRALFSSLQHNSHPNHWARDALNTSAIKAGTACYIRGKITT